MLALSIPSVSSPRAVFCVVGIIYFIVCAVICFRGIKGWLTVFSLFLLGLVILGFLTPSKGEFGSRGIPSFSEQFEDNGKYVNNENLDEYVFTKYKAEKQRTSSIYFMHNPKNPNRISPWLFHPGCLWQAPLIVFLLGIFGFATGANKRREY